MQVRGKLHAVFETQQVTPRFSKREFVLLLDEDSRYPQHVIFQTTGRRMELLDSLNAGQEIEVEFQLRGREWTSPKGETKYFNSLEVFEVRSPGGRGASDDDEPPLPDEPPPEAYTDDDIPF